MIRIPFSRTNKDEEGEKPSEVFSEYCRDELERRRDTGVGLNEKRFKAAVDLVIKRLRTMEENGGKV